MEEKAKEIRSGQVSIEDGFWSRMQEKVIDVVIPFQEKVLNDEVPGGGGKEPCYRKFPHCGGDEGR